MSASKKSLSRTGLLLLYSVVLLVCVLKLSGYERGVKPEPVPREPIYAASMNVDAAILLATDEGNDKHVLLMLGGNWCGWCYTLHDLLHENAAIKKLMDERFELILVDIRSNEWSLERYEAVPRGYPFLIVLDAEGELLTTQNTDVFVDNHDTVHNPERVYAFLKEWSGGPDR